MIKEIVKKWEENKNELKDWLSKNHPEAYKDLVEKVIEIITKDEDYDFPNKHIIHEIDDGDYQGTLLYLIPSYGYQPNEYFYVKVSYGSCSGCDTLKDIRGYSENHPSEQQINDYMTLALHIVQGLKKI